MMQAKTRAMHWSLRYTTLWLWNLPSRVKYVEEDHVYFVSSVKYASMCRHLCPVRWHRLLCSQGVVCLGGSVALLLCVTLSSGRYLVQTNHIAPSVLKIQQSKALTYILFIASSWLELRNYSNRILIFTQEILPIMYFVINTFYVHNVLM